MTTFEKRFIIGFTAFCVFMGIAALGSSFYNEYDLQKRGINVQEMLKR